jgi:thymidylate kinase
MIVYIEGVDGSGKSTFSKALAEHLQKEGFDVVPKANKLMVTHPWRFDRITKAELRYRLQGCLNSEKIYIVDRGELSDIIYRTFDFEKYSALMTLKEFYNIWRDNQNKYLLVHCDSDMSEQLMLARGEDNEISIVEHQKLRYLFNQIMPLFNAVKFDAERSIKSETYLDVICAGIAIQLIINGAKKNKKQD